MSDTTLLLLKAICIALVGWLATAHLIKTRTNLKEKLKRFLIVPTWFPWMGLALGGPVYQGSIPSDEALSAGLSFTVGMFICLFMLNRQRRKG